MATITLHCPDGVPLDHYSKDFLQKMVNHFAHGYFTYGHSDGRGRAESDKMAPAKNISIRLRKYQESRNTEFLIDVANYAMFEFMYPSYLGAGYTPTTEKESPGSSLKSDHRIKSQEELFGKRKGF